MAEYDGNTRARLEKARREERFKRIGKLSGRDKALALELAGDYGVNGKEVSEAVNEFYRSEGLKPSAWFGGRDLVKVFVPEEYRESFLYIIDKLNRFPFSNGWNRRTVRTKKYGPCAREAFSILRVYDNLRFCKVSVEDYIYGRVDEETLDYARHNWGFERNFSYIYAAEIDRGNKKVIGALKDLILSESNTAYLNREMILGIIRSDNGELHKLLGDLLLAARLQEGLRQCICEAMDEGTREAFLVLFKVIEDNNLIRYSSVRRAVCTWIGIFGEESVDRLTDKMLGLMGQCLRDGSVCRRLLTSNDSVEISVALWALGFDEADRAVEAMGRLIDCGTKNQKLTASYYNHNLFDSRLRQRTAKKVILKFSDDLELAAAFLPAYSAEFYSWVRGLFDRKMGGADWESKPKKAQLTDYYDSRQEAEALYGKFYEIYERLPKKGLVWDPCIFPWHRVELMPSDVIRQLAFLAYVLGDEERITQAAGLLSEMSGTYGRADLMTLLLHAPKNRTQRDMLIQCMGITEESTSKKAVSLVKGLSLESRDYELMEDMLRFKRSSLRKELLNFLMGQSEGDMEACLKRLLSDKREEKRDGGLDLLLRMSKDKEKAEFYGRVKTLASLVENPSDKEKVLLGEILGKKEASAGEQKGFGLYDPDAKEEIPQTDPGKGTIKGCLLLSEKEIIGKIKKLDALIKAHKDDEYESATGEKTLIGNSFWRKKGSEPKEGYRFGLESYPLEKELREFYEREIGDYGTFVELEARQLLGNEELYENSREFYRALFGKMPFKVEPLSLEYPKQVNEIRILYRMEFKDKKFLLEAGIEAAHALTPIVNKKNMLISYHYKGWNNNLYSSSVPFSGIRFVDRLLEGLGYWETDEEFERAFYAAWGLELKCKEGRERTQFADGHGTGINGNRELTPMKPYWFLKAYHMGMISRDILYKAVLNYYHRATCLRALTQLVKGEYTKPENRQLWRKFFGDALGARVSEEGADLVGPDTWCGRLVQELYETIVPVFVDMELRRGEAETSVSADVIGISYIQGISYLVRILMALGKDPLSRETYYSWYYTSRNTKKDVLSLLLKSCYPAREDDGKALKAALKGTSIKADRLVEVAMYAPQWIDIVQEYLGWKGLKSGCYYFMAHMNERFDEQKKAMIAKYTPLSAEELQGGAFDIDWFKECYGMLGEKNFSLLYKAAKYISDGQKHSRARKYADAATGKVTLEALKGEIKAKRNKDLLMSCGLVPFAEDEKRDMVDRYQFIQNYGKEAKNFGAQRRASETKAAQIALVNLSVHAGFADVTRLTLNMETELVREFEPFMKWTPVDDVEVCLEISGEGKSSILCRKGGKMLKSLPSRLGKNPYVLEVKDAHKKLKDQYVRAKKLMEESMESGALFTAAETLGLLGNPVVRAILEPLVFVSGGKMGFACTARDADRAESGAGQREDREQALEARETDSEQKRRKNGTSAGAQETSGAMKTVVLYLISWDGQTEALSGNDQLRIAHPLDLYKAGTWHEYQRVLFDRQLRQPFKQVFRELYVKLPEELGQRYSRMFAGNQIQPQRTVGCLKNRRWVADYEEGLQKIYYKENIIARIYALADWFSPSDVEAPTLEWVEFSDRKTFAPLTIEEVPELIYSEVMRDVDLAVSVAHAGGVDPETSHSTIEMRRAIVEFNLPLFGLKNVTLKDSHALIEGSQAHYSVHLGSGVVHQEGGAMLNILPVHSQKRGKLFLPFVDEDPKTAEIMSKIVLLAEDKKIKDPFILDQIR
ncbi:MAG: DUF4132 domain-containing protein [Hungatella sp.]|nr:DUF4132 domain-containing protein [Hungatella sp.]